MRTAVVLTIATLTLALAAPAGAHVTLQPGSAPAGGFTRLDLRVPNERDDKGTIRVEVKMPPGFAFVSYEPVPGWKTMVKRQRLAKPLNIDGLEIDEQVSTVAWIGDPPRGGIIRPGEFQDFGLSLAIPKGAPGSELTFKALQTYEGGEVVRWLGPPDAEQPAPRVTLTAANGSAARPAPSTGATPSASPAAAKGDDDSGTLTAVALAVAALALGVAVGAVLVTRRARSATSSAVRDHVHA